MTDALVTDALVTDARVTDALVSVRGLARRYTGRARWWAASAPPVEAVRDVSFDVAPGETLALVGESGSGKTTTGRCVLRLVEPDAGTVVVEGHDVRALGPAALRALRRRMQPVFQDPGTSLDPRHTAAEIVAEGPRIHGLAGAAALRDRVAALLMEVGLDPALGTRRPHALSSGQRQRLAIARALAVDPAFLVCDEPVAALDVSVRAQVLTLLRERQRARGLAMLFIAHDLAVVRHVADRVAVMLAGRLVEVAPAGTLVAAPRHPYTVDLLRAVPRSEPGAPVRPRPVAAGPAAVAPDAGCPFLARCAHPARDAACAASVPPLVEVAPGHLVACPKPPPPPDA